MISPRFYAVAFVAASLLLGVTGCGSGGSSSPSPAPSASVDVPVTTRSTYGPLEFTLTVPKTTYNRGETVPAVITVTNTASNKVTAVLGSATDAYLNVFQDDKLISYIGFGGGQILTTVSFAPGEVKTFPRPWTQHEDVNPSQFVATGNYELVASYNIFSDVAEETKPVLSPSASERSFFSPPPIQITVK